MLQMNLSMTHHGTVNDNGLLFWKPMFFWLLMIFSDDFGYTGASECLPGHFLKFILSNS